MDQLVQFLDFFPEHGSLALPLFFWCRCSRRSFSLVSLALIVTLIGQLVLAQLILAALESRSLAVLACFVTALCTQVQERPPELLLLGSCWIQRVQGTCGYILLLGLVVASLLRAAGVLSNP